MTTHNVFFISVFDQIFPLWLISKLRQSQSYCTDTECLQESKSVCWKKIIFAYHTIAHSVIFSNILVVCVCSSRPQLLRRRGHHSTPDYYGMASSSSHALLVPPSQLERHFSQQQALRPPWCKSWLINSLIMMVKLCELLLRLAVTSLE